MCQKSFPLTDVEIHASFCKGEQEKPRRTPMKPLPKPIYHLLKDAQIRAKLTELGLKTTGDRSVLTSLVLLYSYFCSYLYGDIPSMSFFTMQSLTRNDQSLHLKFDKCWRKRNEVGLEKNRSVLLYKPTNSLMLLAVT